MARILITSALPYINGIKHLGNLAGSMLPADVYARFKRAQGHEVLYICATDEHGTPAELAAAWQAQTRAGDVLARVGGDEFALLLPSTTTDGAHQVLRRLQAAHPAPWSAGLAEWTTGASLDDLLRDADEQLYAHKAAAETRDNRERATTR